MQENVFFESIEKVLKNFAGARLCRFFSSQSYLCVAIPGCAVYRDRLFFELSKLGFSLYDVGANGEDIVLDFSK